MEKDILLTWITYFIGENLNTWITYFFYATNLRSLFLLIVGLYLYSIIINYTVNVVESVYGNFTAISEEMSFLLLNQIKFIIDFGQA